MKTRVVALSSLLIASVLTARAAVVLVTSSAALGGNDTTDWSTLGPVDSPVTSPFTTVTSGGRTFSLDSASELDQQDGSTWNGNFAPGTLVLVSFAAPMTFSFAAPIFGAGAHIQPQEIEENDGAFTAQIQAFDAMDTLIGAFTRVGNSSRDGDGSAIFIGIKSDLAEISKITFSFTATQSGTLRTRLVKMGLDHWGARGAKLGGMRLI
jgi:hypothetical protein